MKYARWYWVLVVVYLFILVWMEAEMTDCPHCGTHYLVVDAIEEPHEWPTCTCENNPFLCRQCHGKGVIPQPVESLDFQPSIHMVPCPNCSATEDMGTGCFLVILLGIGIGLLLAWAVLP